MTRYRSGDLFCGAGGLTAGLSLAYEHLLDDAEDLAEHVRHVAINHWSVAIRTHETNHPWAKHLDEDIDHVKPRDVFEPGIDLLAAAPSCKPHSQAAGDKAKHDQKRMHPWVVVRWIQELRPRNVLVENVPAFRRWGPLDDDGDPCKEREGDTFDAFLAAIRSLGYAVDHRILNAADYGDPTTRKRLFIVARRDKRPVFPAPTHSNDPDDDLPDWRTAAEVIDWSDPGESIWTRGLAGNGKKPLVQNTMQRIAEGLRRYAVDELEPFADAVASLGKEDVEKLQRTAVNVEDVTPELVAHAGRPFLVKFYGTSTAKPVEEPLDTVTAGGYKFALARPYVIGQHGGAVARSTDEPLPTVASAGYIRKVEPHPFILPRNGRYRGLDSNPAYDPDAEPLHVVTAENHDGHLVSPYLVPFYGERGGQDPRTHDTDDPLPTVPASKSPAGVAQPYLVQYNGQSDAQPVDEPMPTQTTRDRFALVVPDLWPYGLDIRFRMLQPRELAAAMGFPDTYEFCGTKTERVRQIGNAVCVNLARELCLTLLTDDSPTIAHVEPAPGASEMQIPPEVAP